VPILVVSARGEEIDRVVALEIGADDYLVKPFGFRELVARIRAVSRRAMRPDAEQQPIVVGRVTVDVRRHRAAVDGVDLQLTPKEFDLLAFLAADPGAVKTRSEIVESVWDEHWYGPTKTVDVHVASLRRKIGDPSLLETVRGVGYRLVAS
jgi:DNA-binding response OmpR family regulator